MYLDLEVAVHAATQAALAEEVVVADTRDGVAGRVDVQQEVRRQRVLVVEAVEVRQRQNTRGCYLHQELKALYIISRHVPSLLLSDARTNSGKHTPVEPNHGSIEPMKLAQNSRYHRVEITGPSHIDDSHAALYYIVQLC